MSGITESLEVNFRIFFVSFARQLKAEEVYEVAAIWLRNKRDISSFEPDKKPSGVKLFIDLECLGILSWKDVDGLIEIAKALKRFDLVKEVETFSKKKGKSYGQRYTKKKKEHKNSEERQQLERAHETMVGKMTELAEIVGETKAALQKPEYGAGEAAGIVGRAETVAEGLVTELSIFRAKLECRSRAGSGTSLSSDGSSEGNRGEISALPSVPEISQETSLTPTNSPAQTHHPISVSKRDRPIPKPRACKTQSVCSSPVQETKEGTDGCPVSSHRAELAEGVLLSTTSPVLPRRSGYPCYPPSPLTTGTETSRDRVDVPIPDQDDWTGDSGMGTGSGNSKYGGIDEWRSAIKKPPPVPEKPPKSFRTRSRRDTGDKEAEPLYTPLREGTTDKVHSYQKLNRGSPY